VKALVALTAIPEPELRKKLASNAAALPANLSLAIDTLPAQLLMQRPDVFSAERDVVAASADTGSALAQRYPRLTLAGSIGAAKVRSGDVSADLSIWSLGPLALSVPLFDGGRRAANVDAAQARYDEAVTNYRSAVRQAVREVEQALVALQSTGARSDDALTAVEGYRASFAAAEARYQGGLGSLIELEEVRRVRLASELALASLQRERVAAWIALYRAAGGGWTAEAVAHP
jgi:multidrug efflux system outer membrane protein